MARELKHDKLEGTPEEMALQLLVLVGLNGPTYVIGGVTGYLVDAKAVKAIVREAALREPEKGSSQATSPKETDHAETH